MGVVLLAHDEVLDRRVAIKFLRADLLNERFRQRFAEEAQAMARVSHPNVVQVYTCGIHGGLPYFVMEYVDGQTLEQWMARHTAPEDLDEALQVLDGVCEGLAAIHAADTVHRDLKPTNVLLDGQLRPKIADLGLAFLWRGAQSGPRELVGTPAYMAPEVIFADDKEPGHQSRADIYSLGCIAYEIVAGKPPFDSPGATTTLLRHITDEVRRPSSVRPCSHPEIDDVILRALIKDPAKRTPTSEAFQRELAAARIGTKEPVRILVADDDEDFRHTMAMVLERAFPGATIECVADGAKALNAYERDHPSVVIADLHMPGLDGLRLTQTLRKNDPSCTVPIIMLTASGGSEDWRQLAAAGADRFLVKPVVATDVVAMVRRCLYERSSRPPRSP
jgi:eukaryotic-like serine/threonine-protein kinase